MRVARPRPARSGEAVAPADLAVAERLETVGRRSGGIRCWGCVGAMDPATATTTVTTRSATATIAIMRRVVATTSSVRVSVFRFYFFFVFYFCVRVRHPHVKIAIFPDPLIRAEGLTACKNPFGTAWKNPFLSSEKAWSNSYLQQRRYTTDIISLWSNFFSLQSFWFSPSIS